MNKKNRSVVDAKNIHYSVAKVRSAVVHFLIGKFASAFLSLATMLLLLRFLPLEEYGVYVTLLALMGLVVMLSSFGLDAAVNRYIPEIRLTHSESSLRFVIKVVLVIRAVILLLMLGLLWFCSLLVFNVSGLAPWAELYPLFLALIISGGLFNITANILDALLQQRASQLASFTQVLIRFLLVSIMCGFDELSLDLLIRAELVSCVVGLAIASVSLARHFSKNVGPGQVGIDQLSRALLVRVVKFAGNNYGAQILLQTQGPHGLRLVVSSFLGITAAAKFGFIMNIVDLIQRYLPTVLLIRLIRPIFVSRYTTNRDYSQLIGFTALLYKLNLLIVAPAIAGAIFFGPQVVFIMAGDQYEGTHWLLVFGTVLLLTTSHALIISLIANTLEENVLQLKGGGFALLGLFIGLYLSQYWDVYGILAGALVSGVAYNTYAVFYLKRLGYQYSLDVVSIAKIMVAGLLGAGVPALILLLAPSWPIVVTALFLCAPGYLFCLYIAQPLNQEDKALLAQILPAKLGFMLKMV